MVKQAQVSKAKPVCQGQLGRRASQVFLAKQVRVFRARPVCQGQLVAKASRAFLVRPDPWG